MSPEELFTAHVERAEKIATALCWRYRVSGALFYQDEAKSEARLALWRACRNFDPTRQELEIRKIRQHELAHFWNPLFGSPPPPDTDHQGPYDNFWIWAVRQIYGRVIDWFRSYHLIKRMAKGEGPSMIYHERFLSMTRAKGTAVLDGDGQGPHDFDECLPSSDRADGYDDVEEQRTILHGLVTAARLTQTEIQSLRLAYGDDEMGKAEIAELMGVAPSTVVTLLKSAMGKLKAVAQVQAQCAPTNSLNCSTTLSIARPMLRPGI